jgi:hypothetical protein
MPTKDNVGATLNHRGDSILITVGVRGSLTIVGVPIDVDQASELHRQLGTALGEALVDEHYEEWLERTNHSHEEELLHLTQIDQGGVA